MVLTRRGEAQSSILLENLFSKIACQLFFSATLNNGAPEGTQEHCYEKDTQLNLTKSTTVCSITPHFWVGQADSLAGLTLNCFCWMSVCIIGQYFF